MLVGFWLALVAVSLFLTESVDHFLTSCFSFTLPVLLSIPGPNTLALLATLRTSGGRKHRRD